MHDWNGSFYKSAFTNFNGNVCLACTLCLSDIIVLRGAWRRQANSAANIQIILCVFVFVDVLLYLAMCAEFATLID